MLGPLRFRVWSREARPPAVPSGRRVTSWLSGRPLPSGWGLGCWAGVGVLLNLRCGRFVTFPKSCSVWDVPRRSGRRWPLVAAGAGAPRPWGGSQLGGEAHVLWPVVSKVPSACEVSREARFPPRGGPVPLGPGSMSAREQVPQSSRPRGSENVLPCRFRRQGGPGFCAGAPASHRCPRGCPRVRVYSPRSVESVYAVHGHARRPHRSLTSVGEGASGPLAWRGRWGSSYWARPPGQAGLSVSPLHAGKVDRVAFLLPRGLVLTAQPSVLSQGLGTRQPQPSRRARPRSRAPDGPGGSRARARPGTVGSPAGRLWGRAKRCWLTPVARKLPKWARERRPQRAALWAPDWSVEVSAALHYGRFALHAADATSARQLSPGQPPAVGLELRPSLAVAVAVAAAGSRPRPPGAHPPASHLPPPAPLSTKQSRLLPWPRDG